MAPWTKEFSVPLEDVKTSICVSVRNNQQTHELLSNYTELFDRTPKTTEDESDDESLTIEEKTRIAYSEMDYITRVRGQKILIQGEHGRGKSTLAKKIAYDWAMKLFTTFSIVIFVPLSIAKPGDCIEDVIVDQITWKGTRVSDTVLGNVLQFFGHECLLILDGLDELNYKLNVDVSRILTGQKFFYCNVLLTSKSFREGGLISTVGEVQGFDKKVAKQFVSGLFSNKGHRKAICKTRIKVPQIFGESDRGNPMLLMFMCLLIKNGHLQVEREDTITLFELLSNLTEFLFEGCFDEKFHLIGKMALESLQQKKAYVRDCGDTKYFENLLLIRVTTSKLTFVHSTLQVFFAAMHFVRELNAGTILESYCSGHANPLFMENSLFLYFTLQLLKSHKSAFYSCPAYKMMKEYFLTIMNLTQFDTADFSVKIPALFELAFKQKSGTPVSFFKRILAKCCNIEMLYLRPNNPIDLILNCDYPRLNTIYLSDGDNSIDCETVSDKTHDELKIVLINQEEMHIEKFIRYSERVKKKCSFYFIGKDKSEKMFDICQFLSPNVKKLMLQQELYDCNIDVGSRIPTCPHLTHLSINSSNFWFPNESLNALSVAIDEGRFPSLSHLRLQSYRYQSNLHSTMFKLPTLRHLELKQGLPDGEHLALIDNILPGLKFLSIKSHSSGVPNQLELKNKLVNLRTLELLEVSNGDLFMQACIVGNLPKLRKLTLALNNNSEVAKTLSSEILPKLTELSIQKSSNLKIENLLSFDVMTLVKKLDLSNSNLGTNLSFLLLRELPVLTSLIMCHCELGRQDIHCLAQAYVQNKLPRLRHLDISHNTDGNRGNMLEYLFYKKCKWDKITSLNIAAVQYQGYGHGDKWIEYLSLKAQSGCFPALEKLKFSFRDTLRFTKGKANYWENLHTIEIDSMYQPKCDVLSSIAEAVEYGMFPSMKVVWLCNWENTWPVDRLSLRSKGVCVHFITRDKIW